MSLKLELEYTEQVGDKLLTRVRIKDTFKQKIAVGINITCYDENHELNEKVINLLKLLQK